MKWKCSLPDKLVLILPCEVKKNMNFFGLHACESSLFSAAASTKQTSHIHLHLHLHQEVTLHLQTLVRLCPFVRSLTECICDMDGMVLCVSV